MGAGQVTEMQYRIAETGLGEQSGFVVLRAAGDQQLKPRMLVAHTAQRGQQRARIPAARTEQRPSVNERQPRPVVFGGKRIRLGGGVKAVRNMPRLDAEATLEVLRNRDRGGGEHVGRCRDAALGAPIDRPLKSKREWLAERLEAPAVAEVRYPRRSVSPQREREQVSGLRGAAGDDAIQRLPRRLRQCPQFRVPIPRLDLRKVRPAGDHGLRQALPEGFRLLAARARPHSRVATSPTS